jgi:glycerol uptake facilitator protein
VEAIGTFLLVLAIMALAVDLRAPSGWAGLMIGLAVTCEVLVLAPQTGAAINPARVLGPWAASALAGGGAPWSQFPAYVVGSLLGGVAAALVYDALARPRAAAEAAGVTEPAQGTQGDIQGHRAGAGEESAGAVPGGVPLPRPGGTDVRARERG